MSGIVFFAAQAAQASNPNGVVQRDCGAMGASGLEMAGLMHEFLNGGFPACQVSRVRLRGG
jgi:hypothetical protein